jgi:DNA polymerase-4
MSRRFKQAVLTLAPCMEDRGIDEVYLDLTDIEGGSRELAQCLQALVFEATGLSCSIGIGPNKLIAKIASDLDKPRGISIVAAEDFATRLGPLPARKIPGIGPKADQTLEALGIRTIEQLATCEEAWLNQHFTPRYSRWLWRVSRGLDDRALELDPEPRSRSRETTFEQDLHPVRHWEILARTLIRLSGQVSADLVKRGYAGRTVGIKLRTSDFKSLTRDRTIDLPVHRAGDISLLAFECLSRAIHSANGRPAKPIRLLGVRVGELVPRRDAAGENISESVREVTSVSLSESMASPSAGL